MTPIIPTILTGLVNDDAPERARIFAALVAEIDTSNALKDELENLKGELREFSRTIQEDTGRQYTDPDDHLGNIARYVGHLEAQVEILRTQLLEEHHRALAAEAKVGRLQLDKEYGNK